MASLTAIFGSSSDKSGENAGETEKLLHLYWNRAELKKEFARLRNERFELEDRIKEHAGATARLQQQLDQLENLLLDPEWVYNIVTHYQLKSLNLRCQRKLETFAEELKQQREKKQQSQLLEEWSEQRAADAEAIERQLGNHRMHAQLLEDRLQSERHRLATMGGLMKLLRRRSLTASLDQLAADIEAAHLEDRTLMRRLDEVQNRQPPDIEGLSIPTKRLINFMILAFAQQLYLHFYKEDVAAMAKEANDKSIGAINYGGKATCDVVLSHIKERIDTLEDTGDLADILQRRAKMIADNAKFQSEDDAVPLTHSIATVYEISTRGTVKTTSADLLGQNYWNLAGVVSR